MVSEPVATRLAKDFVTVKIDDDRMIGAKELHAKLQADAARLAPGGKAGAGIPWFVFLDGEGVMLASSDGPKGNIGFPSAREEVDHFASMLAKVAVRITPEDIEALRATLVVKKAQPAGETR
jgi:hypothetical protein